MPIAAIPTKYAGVQFRSRLEARWAAMFDLLGKRWEYEPLDLRGWVPDFRLSAGHLVEVCPALTLPEHEAKILYARAHEVLRPDGIPEGAIIDILTDDPLVYYCSVSGRAFSRHEIGGDYVQKRTARLWREAGNRVQWKGAGATP